MWLDDVVIWLSEKASHANLRDACTEVIKTASTSVQGLQDLLSLQLKTFREEVTLKLQGISNAMMQKVHELVITSDTLYTSEIQY